jgi:hypothetical protein
MGAPPFAQEREHRRIQIDQVGIFAGGIEVDDQGPQLPSTPAISTGGTKNSKI